METLRAGTTEDDARIRKAFNTEHLRGLILGGVQLRTAAKDFLEAVLIHSNDLAISTEDVYVAEAGDMGQGLFAAQEISPGRKIGEYMGERLDRENLMAKYGLEASECADYVMQIGEDMWMDASDPGKSNHTRYINHAEGGAENCVMFGDDHSSTIILVIRPVASGEQLLMNYGPGYWSSRNITPNAPPSAASYVDKTGYDHASTRHNPLDARKDSAPPSFSPSSSSSSSSSSSTPHAASDSYADQGRERGEGRGGRESSLSDIHARARAPMDKRADAPLLSDRAGVAADEKEGVGREKVRDQVVGEGDYTFRHFVRGTREASVRGPTEASVVGAPEYRVEETEEDLVVHVELPDRENVRGVDLELFSDSLTLAAAPFETLCLTLPFSVHYEGAKAKFVKKTRVLRIQIPRTFKVPK
jgi:HSP20 family molecular chaperone IbpA